MTISLHNNCHPVHVQCLCIKMILLIPRNDEDNFITELDSGRILNSISDFPNFKKIVFEKFENRTQMYQYTITKNCV